MSDLYWLTDEQMAIQTCISNGYLMEVQKDKLVEGYSFHGRAYRIVRLPENDHSE